MSRLRPSRPGRPAALPRTAPARTALAAVALTGTALLALSACSSGGGASTGAATGSAVSSVGASLTSTGTATQDVDSVTWSGDYRPLYSLDPLVLADYPEETIIPNICEPLLRVQNDYTLTPGLASAYEFTDPTTLVLTIRQGVRFTDGTTMTSEDVAYSLGRNLGPSTTSNYAYLYSSVKDIRATSPTTVTIRFTQAAPTFPQALGTLAGAVVEKKFAQAAGAAFGSPDKGVVCTGPYAVASYDGTSRLVLTRHEHYWDTAHAAHAKTFTFVFTADTSSMVNALTSGQVQGSFDVPSTAVKQLSASKKGTVYVGGVGSTPVNTDLIMARSTGTSADPRVRQALSLVIDRAAIAEVVYGGTADPLYKVAGPGLWGYEKSTFQQAYDAVRSTPDTAAAKALVTQAGATGATLVLGYASGSPQSVQLATIIKQEAAQIGLTIALKGLPNQQYGALFSDAKAREPFDMFFTASYNELPEPLTQDLVFASAHGAMNFSGYTNATVESALDTASQTADEAARARLIVTAEAQLAQDLPMIPIVQPRSITYVADGLTGAPLTFAYMTSPWAAAIGGE